MKEIIEMLNQCSPARTTFYCVVFLLACIIIPMGIAGIIDSIKNKD